MQNKKQTGFFRRLGSVLSALALGVGGSVVVVTPAWATTPAFQMPFPCGEVWHASTYSGHNAIDWNKYPEDNGLPVVASASGTATTFLDSTGAYVVNIDHGSGWVTHYGHLQSYGASGTVLAGDVIGHVGSSGNSSGPHLHWEQRLNGVAQSTLYADGVALSPGSIANSSAPTYTSNNCSAGGTYSVSQLKQKLIRHPNGAFAYVQENSTKRFVPIGSEVCFGGASVAIAVSQSSWEAIPTDSKPISCAFLGETIRHPNGAYAFVQPDGTKRFMPSTVKSCVASATYYTSVSQSTWEAIPTVSGDMSCASVFLGKMIQHPNGARAYVQMDGTKKFVPTGVYSCLGSSTNTVVVSQSTWEAIPTVSGDMSCGYSFSDQLIQHPNNAFAYVQLDGTKKFVPENVVACFGGVGTRVSQAVWDGITTMSGNMTCGDAFIEALIQHPNGAFAYVQLDGTKKFVPTGVEICLGGATNSRLVSQSTWEAIPTVSGNMSC